MFINMQHLQSHDIFHQPSMVLRRTLQFVFHNAFPSIHNCIHIYNHQSYRDMLHYLDMDWQYNLWFWLHNLLLCNPVDIYTYMNLVQYLCMFHHYDMACDLYRNLNLDYKIDLPNPLCRCNPISLHNIHARILGKLHIHHNLALSIRLCICYLHKEWEK